MPPEAVGRLVRDFESLEKAGDFYWSDPTGETSFPPTRLQFLCPCGCGIVAGIKVAGEGAWQWNGSLDKPTATPSILIDRGHWHGYLTDGVFVSC